MASDPAPTDDRTALEVATAILEALHENRGHLDQIDVAAIKAKFPGHEREIDHQIGELSFLPRKEMLGHYRLVRRVGVGASGEVYEAVHRVHGRRVALKVLHGGGEVLRPDLEREARALADLDHPNIARLHSFETDAGVGFLVMDFVAGCSLDRVLAKLRRRAKRGAEPTSVSLLSTVRAIVGSSETDRPAGIEEPVAKSSAASVLGGPYFREVAAALAGAAEALAFAHRLGIVHRDVKPANLLLDTDGRIRLTDFGLAKGENLLRLSRTGMFVGTPYYASPEQAMPRGRVGPAADIWSLGATLYELVTLAVPFAGTSGDEVFERALSGRFRRPRELNPRVPIELERVIGRCLEVHPELRYGTADDLAADLSRFALGEAVRARPVGTISRLISRVRHPTRRTTAAAMLILALGLIVAGATIIPSIQAARRDAAQKQERLGAAERDLEEGIRNSDPESLDRAVAAAADALALDPDDIGTKQALLVTAGRVAYEHTDDERATSYLRQARALAPISCDALVTLGRAALAANRLHVARTAYTTVLERGPDPRIAEELRIVAAFDGATQIATPITKSVPLRGVTGVPAEAVLALSRSSQWGARLLCFPSGLGGPCRQWPVGPRGDAGFVGEMLVEHGEPPRILVIGRDCLFRSFGPIGIDGPTGWEKLDDPTLVACGEDALAEGEPGGVNLHLAILPGPALGQGLGALVVSRMRGIALAALDEHVVSKPTAVRWAAKCDISTLERVELSDGPALLVGLGAWKGWSVALARLSADGMLEQIGSAVLGVPSGIAHLNEGPANDVIAVANASYSLARSPETFGAASEAGWEYGVHILRRDQSACALAPVASWTLPRPTNARGSVRLQDLLLTDPGHEILLSEDVSDVNGRMMLRRTHVASIPTGAPWRPAPGPRLPGFVIASDVERGGSVVLVVEGADEVQRVVRLVR